MTSRDELIRLLASPAGAKELLQRAQSDEAIAEALDSLDDLLPEQALTLLGAIEDPSDEPDLDEEAATAVRRDVRSLLENAPRREHVLLSGMDALLIDGTVEALSNLFRRSVRSENGLWWTSNECLLDDTGELASANDLRFEVARYLQLWSDEEPSDEVPLLVTWSRRAVVRVPQLFRHMRAERTTDTGIFLKLQPPEAWNKARRDRWSLPKSGAPQFAEVGV
jgi:hypothetical protein